MTHTIERFAASLLASFMAVGLALGCAAPDSDSQSIDIECYGDAEGCIDSSGSHHTFVVDSITLPRSAGEASSYGLDLDGDARIENRVGGLMSALTAVTPMNIPSLVNDWVADGTLMILIDVQAADMSSAAGVGGRVYAGANANPAPCASANDSVCGNHLRGGASMEVDTGIALNAVFPGSIDQGQFSSSIVPVAATLDLPELFTRPVAVDLVASRVQNLSSATNLEGIAAGAITMDEIYSSIYPAVVDVAARDCTGTAPACCVAGSLGESLVDLLDADGNCALTVQEMKSNTFLAAVVSPDLDLLDQNGNFAPNVDGVPDSMSLGAGFTAVNASFARP